VGNSSSMRSAKHRLLGALPPPARSLRSPRHPPAAAPLKCVRFAHDYFNPCAAAWRGLAQRGAAPLDSPRSPRGRGAGRAAFGLRPAPHALSVTGFQPHSQKHPRSTQNAKRAVRHGLGGLGFESASEALETPRRSHQCMGFMSCGRRVKARVATA